MISFIFLFSGCGMELQTEEPEEVTVVTSISIPRPAENDLRGQLSDMPNLRGRDFKKETDDETPPAEAERFRLNDGVSLQSLVGQPYEAEPETDTAEPSEAQGDVEVPLAVVEIDLDHAGQCLPQGDGLTQTLSLNIYVQPGKSLRVSRLSATRREYYPQGTLEENKAPSAELSFPSQIKLIKDGRRLLGLSMDAHEQGLDTFSLEPDDNMNWVLQGEDADPEEPSSWTRYALELRAASYGEVFSYEVEEDQVLPISSGFSWGEISLQELGVNSDVVLEEQVRYQQRSGNDVFPMTGVHEYANTCN
jgi:hypothetical protein